MKNKKILKFILCLFLFTSLPFLAEASILEMGATLYTGICPEYGNTLGSDIQASFLQSANGIATINKVKDGFKTQKIRSLLGMNWGGSFRTILFDYYFFKAGVDYGISIWGGKGTTVFNTEDFGEAPSNYRILDCRYSFTRLNIPLILGIAIPFENKFKIFFGVGVNCSYVKSVNNFENADLNFQRQGIFKSWVFPLLIQLEAEYFFLKNLALNVGISYNLGSTGILTDQKVDDVDGFAAAGAKDKTTINLKGYNCSAGVSFYFWTI